LIISHTHRFIFIKTRKTAGTSIEIGLSKFCGQTDVLTPILEEQWRAQLGYTAAQNYQIPFSQYHLPDYISLLLRQRRKYFFNHIPAYKVRQYVPRSVWDGYYKFTIERNPFDKMVSRYYYERTLGRTVLSLNDFVITQSAQYSDYELYTHRGELLVDKVYAYEELDGMLTDLELKLALPQPIDLEHIRAKGGNRPPQAKITEQLSVQAIDTICKYFAREMTLMGYSKPR
jgi:hypothetical protein